MHVPLSRSRALKIVAAVPALAYAGPAIAQSSPTLRIGTVATETYAEPLYARDSGLYAKAGLNVEITIFTTGGQITNALAGGALDIGMADIVQVAQAVGHDVPFAFFAGAMEYLTEAPTTVLAVAKDAPARSARDFEGSALAVYGLRSMAESCVREWLTANGADQSKVKFVEIPPGATAAAIVHGTVAAGLVSEPVLATVRDDIRIIGKPYDACAKRFYINSWFSSRDWLAKNAETARKVAQIAYDTARWANANHDQTAPILAKYAKLEPDTIRAMTRGYYGTSLDPRLMQPVLNIAWKYKLTEKQMNAADISAKV